MYAVTRIQKLLCRRVPARPFDNQTELWGSFPNYSYPRYLTDLLITFSESNWVMSACAGYTRTDC
jgi:hypothetical protein